MFVKFDNYRQYSPSEPSLKKNPQKPLSEHEIQSKAETQQQYVSH